MSFIFRARVPFERFTTVHEFPKGADQVYRTIIKDLERLSGFVTGATQRGSLPAYLSTIFNATLIAATTAAILGGANLPRASGCGIRPRRGQQPSSQWLRPSWQRAPAIA